MNSIITDTLCNKVYFSSSITRYQCWRVLEPLLTQFHIPFAMVRHTNDLWVRDFMPIQIREGYMVQFDYHPSYLLGCEKYLTNPLRCTQSLPYSIYQSGLNLDGGNVIKCDDCVIITDKVFAENPMLSSAEIIDQLQADLQTEVVIIPHDPSEPYGHADGMVRYLGSNRLLINHYVDFDVSLRQRLLQVLTPRFSVEELHYSTARYLSTSWAYLNYLQVGNQLFVPQFANRIDEMAYRQLEEGLRLPINPIPCCTVAKLGGALNCLSWSVMES